MNLHVVDAVRLVARVLVERRADLEQHRGCGVGDDSVDRDAEARVGLRAAGEVEAVGVRARRVYSRVRAVDLKEGRLALPAVDEVDARADAQLRVRRQVVEAAAHGGARARLAVAAEVAALAQLDEGAGRRVGPAVAVRLEVVVMDERPLPLAVLAASAVNCRRAHAAQCLPQTPLACLLAGRFAT